MKQTKYNHITREERVTIAYLKNKKGYSINAVAEAMNRSKSSISEELNNNSVSGVYDPIKAHHKATQRRKESKYQGMKVVQDMELREYVEKNIKDDWSPDEVAGRIRKHDTHIKYASYEAIYKYIRSVYGRQLESHLRYRGKKRKSNSSKSKSIKNRTFIDERPEIILKYFYHFRKIIAIFVPFIINKLSQMPILD